MHRGRYPSAPMYSRKMNGLIGQESVVTMENNYKRVSKELEEEVKHVDLKEAAAAIGGNYENKNGNRVIRLKMMNKEYEVRNEGLFENDNYCQHSWSKIIIYDYVRRKGNIPLTGNWVSWDTFLMPRRIQKRFKKTRKIKSQRSSTVI